VARRPRVPRAEARYRLGLGTECVVLLSFGGFGLPGLDLGALAALRSYVFVVMDAPGAKPAPNLRVLSDALLEAKELGYEDVVGASDVVVTKPGYGIVSDAIGAGARLIYTDRGDFPEYDVIVREMQDWLASVYVSQAELRAGRLDGPLREVLALERPRTPDLSGAETVARRLLEQEARAG
jgi:L-arabinokinase